MPFPNEHAARQESPEGVLRCRRQSNPKGAPRGVSFIFCVGRDNRSFLQSIRFDRKKFTPEQARAWLEEHDFKTGLEEATGKER